MKTTIEFKLAASRSDRKVLLELLDRGKHIYNLEAAHRDQGGQEIWGSAGHEEEAQEGW
jgi:hypothetical protein